MKKQLLFSIFVFCLGLTVNAGVTEFKTVWDMNVATTGATNIISFTVGTSGGTASYSWVSSSPAGSGSSTFSGPTLTITVPVGSIVTLSIFPTNFDYIRVNNGVYADRLMQITQWGTNVWTSMQNAFYGCANLDITTSTAPVLTGLTDMSNMFRDCTTLNTTGSLNGWDVSNITDMSGMFYNATSFNQPLNSWVVDNVTDMSFMFRFATSFNQPLSAWDPWLVTNMSYMFQGAANFNQTLNAWGTANRLINVVNMSHMFEQATSFNQPLSAWDVGNVTNMSYMFESASSFNQSLNAWDVGNVTNMSYMFASASSFNQPLNAWDVGSVTNMSSMFYGTTSFNQDVSAWDISSVTNMSSMFRDAASFNQSLAAWGIKFASTVNLSSFLNNSGLSVLNYDLTLIGFDGASVPNNRTMGATGLQYCDAASERDDLDDATGAGGKGWIISGDSPVIPTTTTFDVSSYSISSGDPSPLPPVSKNGILGTWSPTFDNNAAGTYTFTPDVGQCATSSSAYVTIYTSLPITLLNFTGRTIAAQNHLAWSTATEINNDYFNLQHSNDGKSFTSLNKIKTQGNSTVVVNYSAIDREPYTTTYYRLETVDRNGNSAFSNIITLSLEKVTYAVTAVYPNPTNNNLFVDIFTSHQGVTEIQVLDMLGKVVKTSTVELIKGNNSIGNDISNLTKGLYFIKLISVTQDELLYNGKLVVN